MTVPKLTLRLGSTTAFCGRCDGPVGKLDWRSPVNGGDVRGNLALVARRGIGWIEVEYDPEHGDGWAGRSEFALRRRRRQSPLTGAPVNYLGAFARPGDIVHCPNPKCLARQRVPPLPY
jgi:hypothetical protein